MKNHGGSVEAADDLPETTFGSGIHLKTVEMVRANGEDQHSQETRMARREESNESGDRAMEMEEIRLMISLSSLPLTDGYILLDCHIP
ncbi:hypothetical protein FQN60_003755 [Etheostoma spectabile]|uniref:Uncharacterized protein n=1 Tax=Etheostoma spectabile TaxID=54343 RepID=A0A5J5D0C6_9PERO|nr:hypothetical protein FQN60_003755 [Etheostoma spectabile]